MPAVLTLTSLCLVLVACSARAADRPPLAQGLAADAAAAAMTMPPASR